MARFKTNDVLLYNSRSEPIVTKGGMYFTPYGPGNYGKYRPIYNNTLRNTEDSVNMSDRRQVVAISRQLFAQMAEIEAASKQKADLTIGLGMEPVYNGEDESWGEQVTKWLTKDFYPNCSPMGIAYDWRSCWKLVSKMVDRDGDILMVLASNRYGQPRIEFVLGHRIMNRNGVTTVPKGMKYAGYSVKDGVVYNRSSEPVGYYIVGTSPEDDYVVSTDNAFLIFNPFAFDKGRGVPILAAGLKDGLNLQDIDDFITQILKVESSVYLIEKNETGRAPNSRISNPFAMAGNSATDNTPTEPVTEFMYGGVRYTKPNGDIKSLDSKRPANELMNFITRLEKRTLALMEWPHQFLLSPETIGGAMSRGLKELIVRSITARQQMIEKYALIALQYAVSRGTITKVIPENYKEDYLDWKFTKASELVLDAAYERQSDLADYFAGVKTLDEITSKTGRRARDVVKQRVKETQMLFEQARLLAKEYPEYANVSLQMITSRDMVVPQPVVIDSNAQGTK